jgi:hypothetical protein
MSLHLPIQVLHEAPTISPCSRCVSGQTGKSVKTNFGSNGVVASLETRGLWQFGWERPPLAEDLVPEVEELRRLEELKSMRWKTKISAGS